VWSWFEQLTLKGEYFIPPRIQVFPLYVRCQFSLLVRQKHDLDVGITRSGEVLRDKVNGPDDAQGQGRLLEVVGDAELEPSELLAWSGRFRVIAGDVVIGDVWNQLTGLGSQRVRSVGSRLLLAVMQLRCKVLLAVRLRSLSRLE